MTQANMQPLISGRTILTLFISLLSAILGWFVLDYMEFKSARHKTDLQVIEALTKLTLEISSLKEASVRLDNDVSKTNDRITTFASNINDRQKATEDDIHELEMKINR